MKKILLSLFALLCTMGAWAKINALSDLVNTKSYTIQTLERGFFSYDVENDDVKSSSVEDIDNVPPSGTDPNEKFAFLRGAKTPEGEYYLYCVQAQKFVVHVSGVDVVLSEIPNHTWKVTKEGDYFIIAKASGEKLNVTNRANGASNGCKVANATSDGGNKMIIRVYADSEDFTDAINAINPMLQAYDGASFWNESPVYPKGLKNATTANGQNCSNHVGAAGHTIYKATTAIKTDGRVVSVTFDYDNVKERSCGLYIAGVDIVNANGEVVASDYHLGFTGTSTTAEYSLGNVAVGNYVIRYYVCHDSSNRLENTAGDIIVEGAKAITEYSEIAGMLNSLKDNTNTYVVPFNGNGLGCYDESAVTAIKTQIEETVAETVEAQTAAFVALDDAVDALPPLVPDGTFIRIKNNGGTGYLVSGTGTGLTKFEAVATAATTANSVFYYTNGKLLSFRNGMYIANTAKLTYTNTVGEAAGTTINFEVSKEKGKVQMSFMNGSNVRYFYSDQTGDSNAGDKSAKFTETSGYRFTIEEVAELPITISPAGYATFYCPVAVTLPDGLKAYYVSGTTNDKAQMTEITKVIPANTGVILQGEPKEYSLTIAGEAETVTNKLAGTVASAYVEEDSYVLSMQTEGVGFYKAMKNFYNNNGTWTKDTDKGTHFQNNGFKAYLPKPEGTPDAARFFVFDFGTETAIESVEAETATDAVVYDLAGRRVQGAQKGIFIVNGKKVIK